MGRSLTGCARVCPAGNLDEAVDDPQFTQKLKYLEMASGVSKTFDSTKASTHAAPSPVLK